MKKNITDSRQIVSDSLFRQDTILRQVHIADHLELIQKIEELKKKQKIIQHEIKEIIDEFKSIRARV